MVSQLPAVLWTVDRDLCFTSSTGTGLKALNLGPGEVVGKALTEFFGTDDPEFLPIAMHRKSLAGEPTTYELRWNGRVWETHTEPLRSEAGEIIGCLAMAMDVTERKLAEEELRHSREQLRALAGRLHEVREEQSASVAREIHDELAQDLTAIKFDLAFIEKRLECCEDPTERARLEDKIGTMYKEIDAAIDLVRNIATRLRPPILDELGLVEAIELHAQDFQRRTGVQCDVNLYNVGATGLEQDMQRKTAVFRIFQEILTNVNRHAKATHVWVDLRRENESFILEVRDNGKGIPLETMRNLDGLGILGMRERAQVFGGHVAIDSEVGKGTSVRLTVPLSEFA
jgi:PAS domain S-box-containing protein